MSFKLETTRTFTQRITMELPTDVPGKTEKAGFLARFRAISKDELNELIEDGSDDALLDAVLVGVEDVLDEDGNELPEREALEGVKRNTFAAPALVRAYVEAISGNKAREKNSGRSRKR